ncbi:MAG: ACT domain-containing protein [Varibaculum cambriense]|nr:ACT domain-containing protein [Varibaculum cambriense]MDU3274891.1 ACT domain-containing protein [Varibaculum cambriense]
MKAIMTVTGIDHTGIIAAVSQALAQNQVNITNVSQTLMDEYFTMMAVVSSDEKQDFTYLRNEFESFGQTLNVKINIQSAAIFEAMYNI